MPKLLYCWRCKMDVPMLDEAEWAEVFPSLESIKRYGHENRPSAAELTAYKDYAWGSGAVDRYRRMTGFRADDAGVIRYHRIANLGPPCSACGKLLRTPRAKLCAECGAPRLS
jgi:hypothetical protein